MLSRLRRQNSAGRQGGACRRPELYPTGIRALGSSLGGAWNRLGVILGPVAVGALMSAGAAPAVVFAVLGAVGVAVGVVARVVVGVVARFGEEAAGRRLEEISA